jgi:hypothetical protein
LGVEEIKALADKGYYSTLDLNKCEKNKIETYVAKPKNTGGVANPDFHQDRFQYDQEQNIYICPAGQTLYPGRSKLRGKSAPLATVPGTTRLLSNAVVTQNRYA